MRNKSTVAGRIALLREMSPAGFAIALHLRFTSSRYSFQSYPTEWSKEYTELGLHLQDPIVIWCFTNEGHISWTELGKQDPAGILARASRHGLKFGVAISFVRNGSRSIAGFSRSDREFTEDELAALSKALEDLHDLTEGDAELVDEDKLALREMSVRMTHS